MSIFNIFGFFGNSLPRKTADTDLRPVARFGQYSTRVAVYFNRNFTPSPIYGREFNSVSPPTFDSKIAFSENQIRYRKMRLRMADRFILLQ